MRMISIFIIAFTVGVLSSKVDLRDCFSDITSKVIKRIDYME
jgi:hypothetical protein